MANHKTKPTILIIISHYLPGERLGGPVRTIANMVHWLGDEFVFKIVTSDRDYGDNVPYSNIDYGMWQPVGKAHVRYLNPSELTFHGLRKVLNTFEYDLAYVDSVFSSTSLKTLLLHRLRLIPHQPMVIAPRGQWCEGALRLKSTKKRIFMLLANSIGLYSDFNWHVSSELELLDVERAVGSRQISRIKAIPNLPFPPLETDENNRAREKIAGSARLVFLSRLVRKKGLDDLLRCLPGLQGEIDLDIYGPIEDKPYWRECEALIARLPSNVTVQYRGVLKFDQVLNVLSQYHLFVLPTLSENFGHVILEALAAGCPVLISDQTPWQDVDQAGAGWMKSLDDVVGWTAALQAMIDMDQAEFDHMAECAYAYGSRYRTDQGLVEELRNLFLSYDVPPS